MAGRQANRSNFKERLEPRQIALLLISIFLVSMSVMMFEVSLTRLFSIILYYHFVFMAVSLAIFGLGLGGIAAHRIDIRRRPTVGILKVLTILACLLSVALILSVLLILKLPITQSLLAYVAMAVGPFFLAGMLLSLTFSAFTEHSGKIYFADLCGASVGTLLVILLLQVWGGINTALMLAVIASSGVLFLSLATQKRRILWASIACLAGVSLFFIVSIKYRYLEPNFRGDYLSIKTLFREINDPNKGTRIVYTDWSAFVRTDVTERVDSGKRWIFMDGGAASPIVEFNGDFSEFISLSRDVGFFPFWWGDKDRTLIVGPGGGREVLMALMGGSKEITAVEINPAAIKAVRRYSDPSGGIYDYRNVKVFIDDGRSFIQRSRDRYDIIYLPLVFTQSAEMVGYALAESYVYTKEAFAHYVDHLTDHGRLVFLLHDISDLMRAFTTGLAVLHQKGEDLTQAAKHMVIISPKVPNHPEILTMPLLILKKSPFTESEATTVAKLALALKFKPLFIPWVAERRPYSLISKGELDLKQYISRIPFNVQPVTDDNPFFYQFDKGIPPHLKDLFLAVLLLSILFFSYLLLRKGHKRRDTLKFSLYFSALGLGFMLIEISLIQKFILFLGYPTLSLSVILFSLLLAGGMGSLISSSFKGHQIARRTTFVALAISAVVIIYMFALPWLFDRFLSYGIVSRSLLSMALIFPLGLLMGIPFPSGLRITKELLAEDVPFMWGLNGIMSVVGSVLVVVIAMSIGFRWALLIGAIGYISVSFLSHMLPSKTER